MWGDHSCFRGAGSLSLVLLMGVFLSTAYSFRVHGSFKHRSAPLVRESSLGVGATVINWESGIQGAFPADLGRRPMADSKRRNFSLVSGYDKNVESSSPSAQWRRLVSGRGVEQWQLARFIPWRSQVQILPPQFRHGSNTDSTRK